jgi:hypothetical protein
MTSRQQRVTLLSLSIALLLAVVVNVVLVALNRSAQAELVRGQQFIAQTVGLERLNNDIIKALAELSMRHQDQQIAALLNANGVTFSPAGGSAAAAAVPAPTGSIAQSSPGRRQP